MERPVYVCTFSCVCCAAGKGAHERSKLEQKRKETYACLRDQERC